MRKREAAVGKAIRGGGVPRDEVFVTTRLWVQDAGYDKVLKAQDGFFKWAK